MEDSPLNPSLSPVESVAIGISRGEAVGVPKDLERESFNVIGNLGLYRIRMYSYA